MKVLFVGSGNSQFGISPVTRNQGESLEKKGISISYYKIVGKGFLGYLKNVIRLHRFVKKTNYDIIHVHYSLSAFVVSLSFPKTPIVVSLMGSDTHMNSFWKFVTTMNSAFFWDAVIVKSEKMKINMNLKSAEVVPNGVDLEKFSIRDRIETKKKLGFDTNKRHILFLADPKRPEKNYKLAQAAYEQLAFEDVEFITVFNKKHDEVADYLYACDVLLLTSLWEGSPNAIKEAMSCNVPIVTTRVGDVEWLFQGLDGCYITSFEVDDVVNKLKRALLFSQRKNLLKSRERIMDLKIDSDAIAERIIQIYKETLFRSKKT